jgi:TolA-binding protein
MRQNLLLLALGLIIIPFRGVFSQQTAVYQESFEKLRTAQELFEHEKYNSAQRLYESLMSDESPGMDAHRPEITFYDAICAAELHNQDAAFKINSYIRQYPEHGLTNEAYYYLGRMYFNDNKFKDAQQSLQKTRPSRLSSASRDEYYFMMGYSSMRNNDSKTARNYFSKVSANDENLHGQAFYYLGHLNYVDGKYKDALDAFNKLENDRRYKKIVAEYKLQIYHQVGDYDKITSSADEWLETAGSVNKSDAARIIGDAWYHKGNFEEAMKYMEIFERTARTGISREDHYLLGYTYYRNGEYEKALSNFQQAATVKDSLSQAAFYYIGACYNIAGDKKYAANAFLSAYKMDIDKQISEEALMDFVKITLETGYDPYNEAVGMLESHIDKNPNSAKKDEAFSYLADLYLNSKNYKQALASMESIEYRNASLDEAYQKILYYRGIELFNSNEPEQAATLFKNAAGYTYDETIRCESNFWLGECSFRQANYTATIRYTKDFLASAQAKRTEFYSKAYYNLGYSHFNRKEYNDAITNLKKCIELLQGQDLKLANDAMLRIGDSYFITSQYTYAVTYYDRVIGNRSDESDYAYFQKALCFGATGNYAGKAETLRSIISSYPSSRFRDDAMYEAALTYTMLKDDRNALSYYDKLIQSYPSSSYTPGAYLKKGFIYYNTNEYQLAIESFKSAVSKYPGTKESQEALAALKNVYLDMNQVDQYYAYARSLSFAEVNASEEDSLSYKSAENLYLQGECSRAATAFRKYLDQFPQGGYADNAHFYLAECLVKNGDSQGALKEYQSLVEGPRSKFTEEALVNITSTLYKEGKYTEAIHYYKQLESVAEYQQNLVTAVSGLMRCYFKTENYTLAAEAARRLVSTPKVTDELVSEAHITMARSYYNVGMTSEAKEEYLAVSTLVKNEWAAEALYYLAQIDADSGQDTEAEERIYQLSDQLAAYDYWVAKGFILLADIYVRRNDLFQAKQTLQSVIENYEGPELGDIARQKLSELE